MSTKTPKSRDEEEELKAISKSLHDAINFERYDEVRRILEENPDERLFVHRDEYSDEEEDEKEEPMSAAKRALTCCDFKAYKILAEHELTFMPNEVIRYVQNNAFGERICELNATLAKTSPARHIEVLMSHCTLAHTNSLDIILFEFIRLAFETLDAIPELHWCMRVLAAAGDLKMIFDFSQHDVIYEESTIRHGTKGLYNAAKRRFHFGANNLLSPETAHLVRATMAHEMSHCALDLVFMNARQPYACDDDDSRLQFEDAFASCATTCKGYDEDIVSGVFSGYKKKPVQKRELAVRVPHMLAHYQKESEENCGKLKENRKKFAKLFDYYEHAVLPAMKAAVPVLEKLNDETMEITYSGLTEPFKTAICHTTCDFQGVPVKILDIVGGSKNSDLLDKFKSQDIRDILIRSKISLFKRRKLKETEQFFFERQFIRRDFDGKPWTFNNTLEQFELQDSAKRAILDFKAAAAEVEDSKIFIFSDVAGAGKSTALKRLSVLLKERKLNSWVSYVNLRQRLSVYEKFGKNSTNENSFLKILVEMLEIAEDTFEMEVFLKLFDEGRVILLFDGVDEISPKFEEFFLELAKNVSQNSKNQQWIATRPQHVTKLERLLHSNAFKLLELNKHQSREFLQESLKFHKVEGTDVESSIQQIQKFQKKLKIFDSVLILKMMLELQMAGRLQQLNYNKFSLYEELVEMKMEILAKKGEIAGRDRDKGLRVTLWEVHQIYAIKSIFGDNFKNLLLVDEDKPVHFENFYVFNRWKKEKQKWPANAVSRAGFLTIHNWNDRREFVEFSHRTFAEFFVAKFLIENIEEAIADDDYLTAKEFDLRMKLAAFEVKASCDMEQNFNVVNDFIGEYLTTVKIEKSVEPGCKFVEFLRRKECKSFVVDIARNNNTEDIYRLTLILGTALRLTKFDEDVLKNLLSDGEGKSIFNVLVYENIKLYEFTSLLERDFHYFKLFVCCIRIFDFLRASGAPNWHKITGFGENLTENQLVLPDVEELNGVALKLSPVMYKDDQTASDEMIIIEVEDLKLFYQFLCFCIHADDIPDHYIKRLVWSSNHLCAKSWPLLEKFVEFSEKLAETSEEKRCMLLSELMVQCSRRLLVKVERELVPDIHLNFEKFLLLLCKLPADTIKTILRCNPDLVPMFLELTFARDSKGTVEFLRKHLTIEEISQFFLNIEDFDYKVRTKDFLLNSGKFCAENFNYQTTFRMFFNRCKNVDAIASLLRNIEENCGDEWMMLIGFEPKENFSKTGFHEKPEMSGIGGRYLYKLVNLILCFKIPNEDFEKFFENHAKEILDFIMKTKKSFVEKIFECLPAFGSSSKTDEILRNSVLKLNFLQEANSGTLEALFARLESYLQHDYEKLKNYLKIECENLEIPPLIYAIDLGCEKVAEIHLKSLSPAEILGIFLYTDWGVAFNFHDFVCSSRNFSKFFKTMHDTISSSEDANIICLDDFEKVFVCAEFSSPKSYKNCSEILLKVLSLIERFEISKSEVESFFLLGRNSFILTMCAISSETFADKLFEIFSKYFDDDREKVAEFIRKGFEMRDTIESDQFSRKISLFWQKIENFLGLKNRADLQKFLCDSKFPLLLGINFEIDPIKRTYIGLCTIDEVLTIISKIDVRFLATKSLVRFLAENFFENKKNIGVYLNFRDQNGKPFWEMLEDKKKELWKELRTELAKMDVLIEICSFCHLWKNLKVLWILKYFSKSDAIINKWIASLDRDKSNFPIIEELDSTELCTENKLDDETADEFRDNFVSILKLLNFTLSNDHEIEELEIFFENHLSDVLSFCLRSHKILFDEIFKIFVKYAKQQNLTAIFKSKILEIVLPEKVNKVAFEAFFEHVEIYVNFDYTKLANFLRIDVKRNEISPLVFAIDQSCEKVVEIYRKCMTVDDMFAIFGETDWQKVDEHKSFSHNSSNFTTFLRSLEQPTRDYFKESIGSEQENIEKDAQNISYCIGVDAVKILYEILNYFEQNAVASREFKSFIDRNSFSLHLSAFCIPVFAEKLFRIFSNYCSIEKNKIAEKIRADLNWIDVLSKSGGKVVAEANVFWSNLDNFFSADRAALRLILLDDYRRHHPLFDGIFYDIQSVKQIYLNNCTLDEILGIFTDFHSFYASLLIKHEDFEKFLLESMTIRKPELQHLSSKTKKFKKNVRRFETSLFCDEKVLESMKHFLTFLMSNKM